MHRRINAFLGAAVLSLAASAASGQGPYFSEVFFNPPGADQGQEYIEIMGQPNAPLTGLTLVVIDGDGTAAGVVDQVIPLSGLLLGANGLLLIRDAPAVLQPPPDPATTFLVADFNPDIENGSNTFMLAQGVALSVGQDLDADNNGMLDAAFPGVVLDSVCWLENDASPNFGYCDDVGGTTFPPQTWNAQALYRFRLNDNTPAELTTGGWSSMTVIGPASGPYQPGESLGLTANGVDPSVFHIDPGNLNLVPPLGACCNGSDCTMTLAPACAGLFFNGLDCSPVVCVEPPEITDFFPQSLVPFETITILGTGFGNNPDNICAVVRIGEMLVPIDIFEASDTMVRGVLAPTAPDQVGMPGQLMLMLGGGNRGPFRPAFFDVFVEDPLDTWVWRSNDPNSGAVAQQPIVLGPTPGGDPMVSYIYGVLNQGKLCLFLDPEQPWMTNAKITMWNRLHGVQNGTEFRFRDLKTCVRFHLPNDILACADRLCDVIRCAFGQQIPPVIIACQVLPQPDGTVKLEVSLPNGQITSGTFTICIEKAPMVPTPPLDLPITAWGGATIDPLPMPIVTGFDPNGAGFTVDEIPNDGFRGLRILINDQDTLLQTGRSLHLSAWGRAGDLNDQRLGIARVEHNLADSFFDVFADFSDIGAANVRVMGLDGDSVVTDFMAPNGLVGRLLATGIRIRGCGKVPPFQTPPIWCFWIDPSDRLPFLPAGQPAPIEITELRLLAIDPVRPIQELNQFDVGLSDLIRVGASIEVLEVETFGCIADFDGDGTVGVPDIFAFLSAWFAMDSSADIDGVPGTGVPDIFAFLSLWFANGAGPCI